MTWWQRVRRRERLDREVDVELRDHLDRLTQDYVQRGMSDAEARRRAQLDFGGLDRATVACREARGTKWLLDLGRDCRGAVRSLRATPSFTIVALLVLTLGIGASTAIYSVVDAVVLRGVPFDQGDRLVGIREDLGGPAGHAYHSNPVQPQNFLDWRAGQNVFTGLAAMTFGSEVTLRRQGQEDPAILQAERVTADFFPVLRVQPILGRAFTRDNEVDGQNHVAVISYGLWQRRFGGARDVLGKQLPDVQGNLDIVGVMPASFVYPIESTRPDDVWIPYVVAPDEREHHKDSMSAYLQVIARLRDGVTVDQARARLTQITVAAVAASPDAFGSIRITPTVERLGDWLTDDVRPWMFLLLGAVGLVLLIACVNVANLMLVRATTRTRELGIRAALGATRWDLARVLLVESLVLAMAGAALGVTLAVWGVHVLRNAIPADVARAGAIAVNVRVLGATTLAAVLTGLAFGLAPVLTFSRVRIGAALDDRGRANTAGRPRQWLRAALVVTEVALASVLVVWAILFVTSFARVTSVPLGFDYHDVVTVQVRPRFDQSNAAAHKDAAARLHAAVPAIFSRIGSIPGIESVSAMNGVVPLSGGMTRSTLRIPGRPIVNADQVEPSRVSPGYFAALRVPLIEGRVFTSADDERGEPVLILNEAASNAVFPGERAVGQTVDFQGLRTIVGIVGTIRDGGPEMDSNPAAFLPLAQSSAENATLVLRMRPGSGSGAVPAVRRAVWTEFPDVAIPEARTLEQYLDSSLARRRFTMLLLGLFGAVALAIAAIGIYGVMAYVVAQRTQEIGIRMALGAAPAAILQSVIGRASIYLVAGVAIGLAGARELSGFAKAFLFEVQPTDLRFYAGGAAVLVAVGLIAALVPARRAAGVDPIIALRME